MDTIAYYDGQIGSPDELVVPFNDRSHFFGDGVYDATMAANGRIFALDEHIERFYQSAAVFDIRIPMEPEELSALLSNLLHRVEGPCQFVYWQVTRGVAPRQHSYDPEMPSKLWVWISPDTMSDPNVPQKLVSAEDKRFSYCNAKTLNLLPAVKYSQMARIANAGETVLVRDGYVTECAHSNVLMLKDGALHSHPDGPYILRGIAKTHLIRASRALGVPVIEEPFTLAELLDADEVIVTSSSQCCTVANELDGVAVGGRDPKTLKLISDAVYQEFLDYCGITELPTE